MENSGGLGIPARRGRGQVDARVRVGPLTGVPAVLREFGREPGPLLESAGFTLAQFADSDTEISYLEASRMLARCVRATGCPHFGLLVGQRADSSALGVAGFMLRCAPDVRTALCDLVQHLDLHDQGGTPTLTINGRVTRLGYVIHQDGAAATDQIYDLSIAVACNIMRNLGGPRWNPTAVFLSRRPPREVAPYRTFFRAPLHFNANQCALSFPSHWLDHRIASADALLHRYLEREATELHVLRNADMLGDVHRLMRKLLMEGNCTAGEVARQLCIHERTLNRRLRQQGTSFRLELDDVRSVFARQLLADTVIPVEKIASALSYADASAFGRAFKRWTGTSPARWRARGQSSS